MKVTRVVVTVYVSVIDYKPPMSHVISGVVSKKGQLPNFANIQIAYTEITDPTNLALFFGKPTHSLSFWLYFF